MKVQVHSIRFDADAKLIDYIQKKMDKLEKFYDRITDGEVILKLNNSTPDNKTVEIKLNIPRAQLFVKERSNTFEAALDISVKALGRQLRKHKQKLMAH